jgi:hypothetical protein
MLSCDPKQRPKFSDILEILSNYNIYKIIANNNYLIFNRCIIKMKEYYHKSKIKNKS